MHELWGMAALWIGLALIATLLSIWFRIATALSEIVVGTVAQLIIGALIGASLGADAPWIKFLSGTGAVAAPLALFVLFFAKIFTKVIGVYPATLLCKYKQKEGIYTTLLMSTGLTFGSISALFGYSHNIIDQQQNPTDQVIRYAKEHVSI